MASASQQGDALRSLGPATYFAGVLMVGLTLADVVATIWPLQFGEIQWRYGAWGLLSGFLLTPVFGLFMLAAAGVILGHVRVLKALWWVNLALALVLVAGCVMFALDVLQLRGAVPPEAKLRFDVGAVKAVVKHLLVAVGLFWLGWACRRGASDAAVRRRSGSSGVLVGS